MSQAEVLLEEATSQLSQDFLLNYPKKSARFLERTDAQDAAQLLEKQPHFILRQVWSYLPVGTSDSIFSHFSLEFAVSFISQLDIHMAVALLSRMPEDRRQYIFERLDKHLVKDYQDLLEYPENSAGRIMTSHVNAFHSNTPVRAVLQQLRQRALHSQDVIFVLDDEQQLVGEVELSKLIKASAADKLTKLAAPIMTTLSPLDKAEMVVEKFEAYRGTALAVLDAQQRILGAIRLVDVYQTTKEDLTSDMQTMVGASKEERALSSSFFAVKKRLPWLQINLLTAFAAASVVGMFESLIAEITALAILLPVAAGQSGNAGAQALAVTMRGLTLREITTRHWRKVFTKELLTGLLNGFAIAITCALGVFVWSQSVGLALVIGLAMVLSLVIACGAGALVPIILKKSGLDPAQSSSIVLTTVTDIAGFMSFLCIAMLLSDMLPRG